MYYVRYVSTFRKDLLHPSSRYKIWRWKQRFPLKRLCLSMSIILHSVTSKRTPIFIIKFCLTVVNAKDAVSVHVWVSRLFFKSSISSLNREVIKSPFPTSKYASQLSLCGLCGLCKNYRARCLPTKSLMSYSTSEKVNYCLKTNILHIHVRSGLLQMCLERTFHKTSRNPHILVFQKTKTNASRDQ